MTTLRFDDIRDTLKKLYVSWSGSTPKAILPLPVSGSTRKYFRIIDKDASVLGVYNENTKENHAFFEFTKFFLNQQLPVPELYKIDNSLTFYLLEDLGDNTLLTHITREDSINTEQLKHYYPIILDRLIDFQFAGIQFNYKHAYPKSTFDQQAMMWDLNYFKYMFLKLLPIEFDEPELEQDFLTFTRFLLNDSLHVFVYRDFQSRNIMINQGKPFFIDYQGGRMGHPAYDVASLLFESKTNIPNELREELLSHYIQKLSQRAEIDKKSFIRSFYGFALLRLMQAMGAYGYRGLYENKPLFIHSIAPAMDTLSYLAEKLNMSDKLPHLYTCFEKILFQKSRFSLYSEDTLTITLKSFTFRKKLPVDVSGNGGGHYFDCRSLPNPGRYEPYKHLTGKDKPVQEFLLNKKEFHDFIASVKNMVDASVENYLTRGFKHLMVCFGCTGGQHRSVFSAETISAHLKKKYPNVVVRLHHQEID